MNMHYFPEGLEPLRAAFTHKDVLLFDIGYVLLAMDHYEAVQSAEREGKPNPDSQQRDSGHVFDSDVVFALLELREAYERIHELAPDDLGIKEGEA